METLFSTLLLFAMTLLGLGYIAAAISWKANSYKASRVALACTLAALVADIASFFVHLTTGHQPASRAPMTTAQFIAEHESFSVIALLSLLLGGVLLWQRARRAAASR